MKNPSPDIVFDTVVLRFTRQVYYADVPAVVGADREEVAFQLDVRQSPVPLPGGAFRANIEAQLQQLQELFAQHLASGQFFSRFQIPTMPEAMLQDLTVIGQHLYTLLPLAFQQAFPRLVQSVFEKGRGLRLILEARAGDKADRLLSLPWELLFFEATGVFLARSPRVLIARRLIDAVRRSPLALTPPFNVVHVIAHTPDTPRQYQIDAALWEMEQEKIPQAVQPGAYHLVAEPGSLEQLLSALREQPYHIMHFLGHGEVLKGAAGAQAIPERGYLRFVDTDFESQWASGEQLQHLLEFTPTLQLVVLNACHGGANVARSVALELVYHGLPYVVAIQGDILQVAARHFIEAFYTELQRGSDIAYAVAAGRAEIAAHLPQTLDWCLPVLYTNVGLVDPSPDVKASEQFWQWMSVPQARQRLGMGNLVLGVLHLLVGLLLLLSKQTASLPSIASTHWITALSAFLPVLVALIFYRRTPPDIPAQWPVTVKFALLTRVLGAASLSFGLSIFYAWLIWLWLIAVGFWDILAPVAQSILLGLVFVPGAVLGWRLGYSQILGHSRAFISNSRVELPAFEWGEITVILGGYVLLLFPWIGHAFWPHFITPPWGNIGAGILLLGIGYALWKERNDGDSG